MLVNQDFKGGYVINILSFVIAFLFVLNVSFRTFIFYFERAIFIIASYSLIVMIIYLIMGTLPFPQITNVNGYEHYNAFLSTLPVYDSTLNGRLYGPFREPGVFQIFLNVALAFHIYLEKRITFLRGAVYITAVLLTFSTAGYIVLTGILVSWLLGGNKIKYKKYYLLLLLVAFGFLFYGTDFFALGGKAFVKFSESGLDNASTVSRLGSIWGNLDIMLHNPLVGVGYTKVATMFREYCAINYGVGIGVSNTNTILYQFAAMGVFYGLLWFIPFYRFFSNLGMAKAASHVLGISIMLSFMGENMIENIIVYIFIGYGLVYSNKRLLQKN